MLYPLNDKRNLLDGSVNYEAEIIVEKENLLSGKHILLVDDDMRNVFALTTTLESVGIHVHFAENGREALDILQGKPFVRFYTNGYYDA